MLTAHPEHITRKRPAVFAQEPCYNDFDTRLLAALSITKVDHPTAFCLLTHESFAFCPGAEHWVILRTLLHDPAIFMVADLSFYEMEVGSPCANRLQRPLVVKSGNGNKELISAFDAEKREDLPKVTRERAHEMIEKFRQDSLTVKHYKKDKLSLQLPDLVAKDYPFYEQHIYWRPPRCEIAENALPWPTMI